MITNTKELTRIQIIENIAELKGLLADAMRRGLTRVILKVPVRLFAINTEYQTPLRTERDLDYLIGMYMDSHGVKRCRWDERKLLPLTGVPHWDTGLIFLVDGYGRTMASQIIDADKYEELEVLIILDAPEDAKERDAFEAELFMGQGGNKPVTPLQKHGARRIIGDPVVKIMDKLEKEYKYSYKGGKGKRNVGIIGSYSDYYAEIQRGGIEWGRWFFDIMFASGFYTKPNGYAVYIMRSMGDLYKYYEENRDDIKRYLSDELRKTDYRHIHAAALEKYDLLGPGNAFKMYMEDMIVDGLGLEHKRYVDGTRVRLVKTDEADTAA